MSDARTIGKESILGCHMDSIEILTWASICAAWTVSPILAVRDKQDIVGLREERERLRGKWQELAQQLRQDRKSVV